MQDAARQAGSFDELCATLEQRIERPEQRTQFRNAMLASRTDASVRRGAPDASTRRDGKIGADEVRRAEQELVRHVGPIARILVKRASDAAGSADEFWQLLAAHISADADRQAFLRSRG